MIQGTLPLETADTGVTPRLTRLVRVPDLQALRFALVSVVAGSVAELRRTAIILPTHGAREELRRWFENCALESGRSAVVLPDLVTRAEFYRNLHAGLEGAPPLLTEPERDVLLRRSARKAIAAGAAPPFRLRAGLIVQMLEFYDELRRREQTLDDFERHARGALADSAETDRGAERLLKQTDFLCAAYAEFERSVSEAGAIDEHSLRSLLLGRDVRSRSTYERIVVAVADQGADRLGLYGSDFDLLTRLPGVLSIDALATEALLGSGFHERIHALLPDLSEERFGEPSGPAVLASPESSLPEQPWFVSRDREEELVSLVRLLKARAASANAAVLSPPLDRIGIVFQRPLPYLYLARQVFADGGIPYQALDSLPLSAEPFAATIDVVFSFLEAEASRASLIELLGNPHLVFLDRLGQREIAALDLRLREAKYTGGWDRLEDLSAAAGPTRRRAGDLALEQAGIAALALRPVRSATTASAQFDALLEFIRTFEQHAPEDASWAAPHQRARAAVLASLHSLRHAHARHDDERLDIEQLSGSVRRWIDSQTFAPRTGGNGIRMLDAASAPFSDLDELHIVGLVERDWPEPSRRSIFYPAGILANLGWPADASRVTAARARFQDLLTSPRRSVRLSLFTLEDDAIVSASSLLEEVAGAGMQVERWPAPSSARVFSHEAVQFGDPARVASMGLHGAARWLALRASRGSPSDPRYKGFTAARETQTYAVSYLERYLECPFKYFANRVLRLPEERDEESGLSPLERGHFVHQVFETFFRQWHGRGGGGITTANVADALDLFEAVAERMLLALPEGDRALERTHLLGSAVSAGLAERAFAFEMEQGGELVERLLEHEVDGEFTFAGEDGPRRVRIRAKADRLDLMNDGSIRVIDYKLGRAPKAARALQLPIYGVIAEQALEGRHGRSWRLGTAGYVAFKEKEAFVALGSGKPAAVATAIAEGQRRLLEAIDRIERGEFPVAPDEPYRCQWCGYAGVCRKDYVGDE